MLKAQRRAEMTWNGTLARGQGEVKVGSGVGEVLPMTWASRTEQPDGKTSPEELLAAAHAGCYAMALALTLAEGGTPPERLQVSAICTLEEVEQKPTITRMELAVVGTVAGMDAAGFEQAAHQAEQLCPVSNALHHNVVIQLHAHLEV
ncbi:MAG TPA: OsmC family peroxiredoxin [Ktedonobacteraceae bacterium]|nr:OsmC family peroxiredoxin [Ktedonobacteraceae bacterium]